MRQLSRAATIICLTLALCPACHDSADSTLSPPETTVFGSWEATVSEVDDTCDDVRPADLAMSVDVEPYDIRHLVRFRDYGAGLECWIQILDVDEDTLSWTQEYDADLDCNEGCRIHLRSSVELVFGNGGTYSGVETVSYEPLTAECDVPACGFPCADPLDHMLWERRDGRGCGFACTTTYHWEASLDSQAVPVQCAN